MSAERTTTAEDRETAELAQAMKVVFRETTDDEAEQAMDAVLDLLLHLSERRRRRRQQD